VAPCLQLSNPACLEDSKTRLDSTISGVTVVTEILNFPLVSSKQLDEQVL
jgi:hypothetical protein